MQVLTPAAQPLIRFVSSFKWILLSGLYCACSAVADKTDWPEYHGDGARSHYSVLKQVDSSNVADLTVAWTYASGGLDSSGSRTQMQCNPIIVDGVLYGVSADIQVFAVDAANGRERWKSRLPNTKGTLSRGVSYWTDGSDARIFFGGGRWLHAIDAKTGMLIPDFGDSGRIDLRTGIQRPGADNFISSNTPNTVYKDLIIVAGRVSESETALLGDIRAFDVRSGELRWTFKTIPDKTDSAAYKTWSPAEPRERLGGANSWMGMAIDRELGIVYAPTGSAAFDFWGGNRVGDNLYANCLLALDAATGKKLWHYQLVRHDIWDRDPPATPNLVTITHKGKKIKAVALITKQGHTFVFDRVTGEPVYPMEEIAFSQEAVEGERPATTQPVPVLPLPFTRQQFTQSDLRTTVSNRDSLITLLDQARTGSPYIPITEKMTIFFPGTDGGAQWGGAAADPDGILYIPAKEIPVYTTLKRKQESQENKGAMQGSTIFNLRCASCHGEDMKGNHDGSFPPLLDLSTKMNARTAEQIITSGRGMMPPFSHISDAERKAIVDFLFKKADAKSVQPIAATEVPFHNTGYNRWYHEGYPVNTPPWGTLTALDLNSGQLQWQVPLGEYPELTAKGVPITGTDNYGGPVVTAGGLIFIAATRDEKIRAFSKVTGKKLWEASLPAAGYATPSMYMADGKQYLVIACGGGKLNTKSGDQYVAFSLP